MQFAEIIEAICKEFRIHKNVLLGQSRKREDVRARWALWGIAREFTDLSFPVLGRLTGGRDHTTVMHGLNAIDDALLADRVFRQRYLMMLQQMEEKATHHMMPALISILIEAQMN